ncbi:hypothetical protein DOY81_013114, partial [Sarcophaga bullata]
SDYMCDAIFVYKEENINEILIDNSPIHCESKIINGQNTVSVIVPDSSSLDIGESYRFCLVMAQEHNIQSDITVGCSNITQLQISKPENLPKTRQYRRRPYADLNKFDRSIETEHNSLMEDLTTVGRKFNTKSYHEEHHLDEDAQNPYDFVKSLNKSFIPGIGLGILVTSLFVLIWGASRLRKAVNVTDINSSNNSCN